MNTVAYLLVVLGVVELVVCLPALPPGAEEFMRTIETNAMACKEAENVGIVEFEMFKSHQLPFSREGKCFVGCFFEKMGVMVDGAYSRSSADMTVKNSPIAKDPGMMAMMLEGNAKCEQEVGATGTDKCVTGPQVMACFIKIHQPNM